MNRDPQLARPSTVLCIFAKPPCPGTVKTRLADTLGEESATRLAAAFLHDTWSAARQLLWARVILATTHRSSFEAELGIHADSQVWLQGTGDLGQRLERILQRALQYAPLALVIGSDSPGLPAQLLDRAHRALSSSEAVLGPCDDGGFYLIGLSRCPAGLLSELPWSSPETFQRTFDQIRHFGLSPALLPTWFDVDRVADLERLHRSIERGEVAAPKTARVLSRIFGTVETEAGV
jgi:uncharacterized protein